VHPEYDNKASIAEKSSDSPFPLTLVLELGEARPEKECKNRLLVGRCSYIRITLQWEKLLYSG